MVGHITAFQCLKDEHHVSCFGGCFFGQYIYYIPESNVRRPQVQMNMSMMDQDEDDL